MNDIQFKAELWEIQVWIMLILALLLWETGHIVLFWVVLAWSIISFIGAIMTAAKGKLLEQGKLKD